MKKLKLLCSWRRTQRSSITTSENLAFILILGQSFAIFPVCGLRKSDVQALRFHWFSWCTAYTISYLVALSVFIGFHIYHLTSLPKIKFGHLVTLLFFLCSFVTTILFLRLASEWPKLIQNWTEIDYHMRIYGVRKRLPNRLKLIATTILLAALFEHAMYLTTAITDIPETEEWESFKTFLKTNFSFVFTHISFSVWKGLIFFIINVMCTFTWNYMDLFIMLVSMTLSEKFKQITSRLRVAINNEIVDLTFWKNVRNDYNKLSNLCNTVDRAISGIILLSFGNNIFVILVQLFNSLKPRNDNFMGRIYFLYSFGFLVTRAITVLLYAASINEASKEPTPLLLSVSGKVYNVEIERFLYKIYADPCALTGKRFFNVTRSLVLNIAGAIVTYELVLIQFKVVT